MVSRGRENLIFNDARVWRGTNPSMVLEFSDFRGFPASRPTQILERRLRPLRLERPKAKDDWPKHRCASGITRVAPAAECAPPRTRHRPQARGAGNSHFSSENFVGDLRANGCSQRASNPVDGEYDSNPFFHNCRPRSNGMTAGQFRHASTTNRANRSAIAASSLAGRADFQDRTKLTQAAVELQVRSKARGTARKRGRPRTARRAAHRGSNLAIPGPPQAHSTSSQARHEHHFQLGRRRVDRREENERAGRQLRLRSIAHEGYEFPREGARPGRDARVQNLPENSANRSSDTQAAAESGARVASNERFSNINGRVIYHNSTESGGQDGRAST